MKFAIALALGLVATNAQTTCFGCAANSLIWCYSGSQSGQCKSSFTSTQCNSSGRTSATTGVEGNAAICFTASAGYYSSGVNDSVTITSDDMIVGTENEAKSITKTVPMTQKSVYVMIDSTVEGDACWMFTNVGTGVTVWEITQNDSSVASAASVAADEMQFVTGTSSKKYVATSTSTADQTFDIMYQGGYSLAVAAVSVAALTLGSF